MYLYSCGHGLRWLFAAAPSYLPPPSNLMIWAALNAFPFGLITLWEDWHHVRSERAISPRWPLGKTAVSLCMYSRACICVCVFMRVQYLCMLVGEGFNCLYHTHKCKETHIFLLKWATDTVSSHRFFFSSWSSVFSFRTHLMSEQEIKSAAYSTRLGPFIWFTLFGSCIYCTCKQIYIYLLSIQLQSYPALQ